MSWKNTRLTKLKWAHFSKYWKLLGQGASKVIGYQVLEKN